MTGASQFFNPTPPLIIGQEIAWKGGAAAPIIGGIELVQMNGQLLDPDIYPALFAIYGTTYGGDGVTTFGVPDRRAQLQPASYTPTWTGCDTFNLNTTSYVIRDGVMKFWGTVRTPLGSTTNSTNITFTLPTNVERGLMYRGSGPASGETRLRPIGILNDGGNSSSIYGFYLNCGNNPDPTQNLIEVGVRNTAASGIFVAGNNASSPFGSGLVSRFNGELAVVLTPSFVGDTTAYVRAA